MLIQRPPHRETTPPGYPSSALAIPRSSYMTTSQEGKHSTRKKVFNDMIPFNSCKEACLLNIGQGCLLMVEIKDPQPVQVR
ncbi:hypothetical protein EMCRGX_G006528 [Ephydatia muelleri]